MLCHMEITSNCFAGAESSSTTHGVDNNILLIFTDICLLFSDNDEICVLMKSQVGA